MTFGARVGGPRWLGVAPTIKASEYYGPAAVDLAQQ